MISRRLGVLLLLWAAVSLGSARGAAPLAKSEIPLIGYTEFRTNLPGGRHANVRTMRAVLVKADGTGRREVGAKLVDNADAWTQFAGWSPDGKRAIVSRGWQSPENAKWEEEHKQFRMEPGKWALDSCLLDLATGGIANVTAVDRVSHYNGGLFFLPDGRGLGFTPLIKGVSKPHVMNLDGRNKRDVSGKGGGFAYGYSASPDGKFICYHENYQIYVSKTDGSDKRHLKTGNRFDFAPQWSPDGKWLLFVGGEHYNCHPHVVRADGSGLKKIADRRGYRGVTEFLDVFDFHGGSSDLPAWSIDGSRVFFTAKVGKNVELFQTTLDGKSAQLTKTPDGSSHYHPQPSPDGKWLAYGSQRDGVRQLYVMNLADRSERRITDLKRGQGAMWPHWQPGAGKGQPTPRKAESVEGGAVRSVRRAAAPNALQAKRSVQGELRARPEAVVLDGPESTQQLLVSTNDVGPHGIDLTHKVRYEVVDPRVARVDAGGLIEPRAEGKTEVLVRHEGQSLRVAVEVRGMTRPAAVSFEQQIIPLFTKAGCNAGGCHGKAEGQNGFKLSVFGFDPRADYEALVSEGRGRRLFPAAPASSLLVGKATGRIPHGGGRKITEGSLPYKRLVRWIAEGMNYRSDAVSPIVAVEVEPKEQHLALGGSQQLRVTAIDERGQRRCVSAESEYESNAPAIAWVDRRGRVQAGQVPGEAAVLVRYMGQVTVCRVTIPRVGVRFKRPPEVNFIDGHVWNKLESLGIPPSELADDATFLRRVYLDTIGTLPTATEARAFLADADGRKRAKLIDRLLERPEYSDYWAQRWADLLRVDRDLLTAPGAVAMTRWLRKQIAENRPYDAFVRDIVTAEGRVNSVGPAGFFKALGKPEVMSRSVSQLFLGVRIECAQCHHHPSDKWGQDDYFALAGFFTGVGLKGTSRGDAIVVGAGEDLKHPRTGKAVPTRTLGAAVALVPGRDRRAALADWMTAPENPYFARAIVNRLWSHYFGRGLIEPVDDLRATNPATNGPLLDELAAHLVKNRYDLRAVTRAILNSRVYQFGAATRANASDEQNFSHARARTMPAEVLLDALSQATGVAEKFNGTPEGVRAIQLWDNRMPSYFLKLFGRPARTSVCECERSGEPSIAQALHLMNAPEIAAKIHSRRGTARRLADSSRTPAAIVEELYLGVLARFPTRAEEGVLLGLFREEGVTRRAATEDALWALLNTKEFLYNH